MPINDRIQWLGRLFAAARRHADHEREQRRIADLRLTVAIEAVDARRRDLIEAIPDGAGQEHARFVPWQELHFEGYGWTMLAGAQISRGARELGELARILGEPVRIADVNGGTLYAEPGDTFEQVRDRYHESGGVGMGRPEEG